jgi:DNA helicase HerA-like ATPase
VSPNQLTACPHPFERKRETETQKAVKPGVRARMRRLRDSYSAVDNAAMNDDSISVFAETNWPNRREPFGIRQADRRAHMYVIGKTGTGKSTLPTTLLKQDLEQGRGVALLVPHGDLCERALQWVPETRKGDLIYFNVPVVTRSLAFNPLESVPPVLPITRPG